MSAPRRFHLARAEAVLDDIGRRHCAQCGDFIDPIAWCPGCRSKMAPCGSPHRRLFRRGDAAFCDDACRRLHRDSFARDCLPKG